MASTSLRNGLLACGVCVLLINAGSMPGKTKVDSHAASPAQVASPEKIAQFVRDRFEVPENVKLTVEPLNESQFPIFFQTVVTSDDGKQKRTNNVFITKDGRCLVLGNVFALHDGSTADLIRCLREAAKIPPQTDMKVGAFDKTAYPEFYKSVVTANDGKNSQSGEIFITKDRRIGILGIVLPFREDVVRSIINTKNMPSQGPASAPVTVVEYADLQCPTCARLQEFLEKQLLPKYGDKVRVIFKEFPLVQIHDWSPAAAIANECVYQIKPEAFAPYRSLIFQNQVTTNTANLRDNLLSYADQVGVDRVTLAACLDSKASLSLVDAGANEGKRLGIQSTPTCFINGRMLVGYPSAEAYYTAVDAALKVAK